MRGYGDQINLVLAGGFVQTFEKISRGHWNSSEECLWLEEFYE
jgi:hypothetical protein